MDAQKLDQKSYRVAISGYYGFRNSGDEAVLRSILLALQEQSEQEGIKLVPVVLSVDPEWTSRMYGVEAVHRMRPSDLLSALRSCDALISGGGSLLQDATGAKTIPYYAAVIKLAQWLGKPTFIYAQGIGPVYRGWLKPIVRNVMKRSKYISVRDTQSAELLVQFGVKQDRIEVVPDPVMGMPLPDGATANAIGVVTNENGQAGLELPVVGIAIRDWRSDGADLDSIADALAQLSMQRAVRYRFLPFHLPSDVEASERIIAKLSGRLGEGSVTEIAPATDDPQQMLQEVSRCDLLFGMRLHALIYAANQYVPLIGLSYDPKIDQFLARLHLKAVGSTDHLSAESFTSEACRLLDQKEQWQRKHRPVIDQLRQQSQLPAQQIVQYLRHNRSR